MINESGVRVLLTIIPSKYRKQVQDWISGMLDPIDEQSKKKAYELYKTDLIEENAPSQIMCIYLLRFFFLKPIK